MDIPADYDRVAEAYAAALSDELRGKPLDRWLLARIAAEAPGPILEIGCGPGHIAAFLADHGATVQGLDLSPGMIAVAAARHPNVRFSAGDFSALAFADASLGGVVAFYALVHQELEERTRPADRVPPTRDGVDRLSYRRSHAPSRPLQVSTVPPSLCRGLGEAGLGVGGQWRRRRDVRRPEGSLRAGLEVVAVETPRDPDAARPQRPSPRAR